MVQFKAPLSTEQRAARKAAYELLLGLGGRLADYLKRTFWIDAKKYVIRHKKCKVICHSSRLHPILSHPRLLRHWRGKASPRVYRIQLKEYFKELKAHKIRDDVDSLPDT